jgi:hypothetical protein
VKNGKNILDNYLKEKVEEAHFDLQEEHWQHALAALDAQDDDDKKPFGWWRTLAIAGLLLLSGIAYTWYTAKPKQSLASANIPADVVVKQNNTTPIATNILPNTTNTSDVATNATNTQTNIASTQTNTTSTTSNNTDSYATPDANIGTTASTNNTDIVTKRKNTSTKQKAIAKDRQTVPSQSTDTDNTLTQDANQDLATTTDATAIPVTNEVKPIVVESKLVKASKQIVNRIEKLVSNKPAKNLKIVQKSNTSIADKVPNTTIIADDNTDKPIVNKVSKTKNTIDATNDTNITIGLKTKSKKNKSTTTVTTNKDALAKAKTTTKTITNNTAQQVNAVQENTSAVTTKSEEPITKRNPKYLGNLYDYKETKSLASWTNPKGQPEIVIVNKQQAVDATTNVTTGNEDIPQPKWQANKSSKSITATVLGSLAASPKTNTGATNWQPSAYAGVGYWFPMSDKWDMHVQVGATYMGGLTYNYTATNFRFGFGVDSTLFSLQHKSLYQLCIPITAAYKFSLKHSIMGGFGANFGLDVSSDVKNFSATATSRQWGYNTGYTSIAPFLQLGYNYQLNKHIYLHALWQQGLVDITNNVQLGNMNVDRNSKASIGVTYKLK